ncbi:polyhydroxyalkanoate synthesis regulator phasin [Thermodesulfovibrio aggregans]|uniref:Polyhydroxyalkanoate synthesis regulator phasin n=1 Tax=Thermodesulfovibrio aggregans TaxID=86166 RepID=A0A0U9HXF7_9BACT|nr:hypothetical protein [Thermodesulfovibrio aggregans]GAQ95629.1 polyhydroxyalkanoate synthesis regulator phasin [Thermodesulfovibrio aggregans]
MALQDIFKNMIFACLGMQEVLKDFLNDLVKRGKMSESEAAKIVNEFISKSEEAKESFKENFKEMIEKAIQGMNLATRQDLENLKSTINEMNLRISKIEEKLKE